MDEHEFTQPYSTESIEISFKNESVQKFCPAKNRDQIEFTLQNNWIIHTYLALCLMLVSEEVSGSKSLAGQSLVSKVV